MKLIVVRRGSKWVNGLKNAACCFSNMLRVTLAPEL